MSKTYTLYERLCEENPGSGWMTSKKYWEAFSTYHVLKEIFLAIKTGSATISLYPMKGKLMKLVLLKKTTTAMSAMNRIKGKDLWILSTGRKFGGVNVHILSNGQFFSGLTHNTSSKRLTIRKPIL